MRSSFLPECKPKITRISALPNRHADATAHTRTTPRQTPTRNHHPNLKTTQHARSGHHSGRQQPPRRPPSQTHQSPAKHHRTANHHACATDQSPSHPHPRPHPSTQRPRAANIPAPPPTPALSPCHHRRRHRPPAAPPMHVHAIDHHRRHAHVTRGRPARRTRQPPSHERERTSAATRLSPHRLAAAASAPATTPGAPVKHGAQTGGRATPHAPCWQRAHRAARSAGSRLLAAIVATHAPRIASPRPDRAPCPWRRVCSRL